MPLLKANEAEFYYEVHGAGHPLILIAGYSADHSIWLPMLEGLSKHFKVIIFDNRGVGQTRDDGRALTAELMAQDVLAIAKELQLSKPHIAGHSMGGNVAQVLAAEHADKINKVCLLTTTAKWRDATLMGVKIPLRMRELDIDMNMVIDAIVPWMFGDSYLQNPKNISRFKSAIMDDPHPQSLEDLKRHYQALVEFEGNQYLSKIQTSTLVVYGLEDIVSLPYEADNLVSSIRDAKKVSYQCGHTVMIEAPQFLTMGMVEFLI